MKRYLFLPVTNRRPDSLSGACPIENPTPQIVIDARFTNGLDITMLLKHIDSPSLPHNGTPLVVNFDLGDAF